MLRLFFLKPNSVDFMVSDAVSKGKNTKSFLQHIGICSICGYSPFIKLKKILGILHMSSEQCSRVMQLQDHLYLLLIDL